MTNGKNVLDRKFRNYKELYETISKLSPNVFNKETPSPLKVGIHLDLYDQLPEISHRKIHDFLSIWVRRREYVLCMRMGVCRFNLDEEIDGVVGPDAQEFHQKLNHNLPGNRKFKNVQKSTN